MEPNLSTPPTLADFLVREGIISAAQLNRALDVQRDTSRSIGRILVEMSFITEKLRMSILQKRFGYDIVQFTPDEVEPHLLAIIPYTFAEKHRVVPVRQLPGGALMVAMEDPSDLLLLDAIKHQISKPLKPVVTSHETIQAVLARYPTSTGSVTSQGPESRRAGRFYRLVEYCAFPVLTFLPLILLFIALYFDLLGFGRWLFAAIENGVISKFDLGIYIALLWGLWTVMLYELNGVFFGRHGAGN